jgi:hypothetical protein
MDARALDFWIREGHRARALRQLAAIEAAFYPNVSEQTREEILARYNRILCETAGEEGQQGTPTEEQEAEWARNRGELNAILSMRG